MIKKKEGKRTIGLNKNEIQNTFVHIFDSADDRCATT